MRLTDLNKESNILFGCIAYSISEKIVALRVGLNKIYIASKYQSYVYFYIYAHMTRGSSRVEYLINVSITYMYIYTYIRVILIC